MTFNNRQKKIPLSLITIKGGIMKKLNFGLVVMIFVGLATTAIAAVPGPGNPGPGNMQDKHMGFNAAQKGDFADHASMGFGQYHRDGQFGPRLNLTREQKDKLKEIREHFFADTHDLRYDIRIMKLETEKLFTDPKADGASILVKDKELNSLVGRLMDKRAEMMMESRKILTPEQIQRLGRGFPHHSQGPMRRHADRPKVHQMDKKSPDKSGTHDMTHKGEMGR
jgi:Spy/CpxP family protein refolding chaperone